MTDPAYIVDLGPIVGIPVKVSNATWPGGYFELYLEFRQSGMTAKAAWSRVEAELAAYGLQGKYTSFESFRVSSRPIMRRELKRWRSRMREPFPVFLQP